MTSKVTKVSDNFTKKMSLANVIVAGSDDLQAGTLQAVLQALATRIALVEDAI